MDSSGSKTYTESRGGYIREQGSPKEDVNIIPDTPPKLRPYHAEFERIKVFKQKQARMVSEEILKFCEDPSPALACLMRKHGMLQRILKGLENIRDPEYRTLLRKAWPTGVPLTEEGIASIEDPDPDRRVGEYEADDDVTVAKMQSSLEYIVSDRDSTEKRCRGVGENADGSQGKTGGDSYCQAKKMKTEGRASPEKPPVTPPPTPSAESSTKEDPFKFLMVRQPSAKPESAEKRAASDLAFKQKGWLSTKDHAVRRPSSLPVRRRAAENLPSLTVTPQLNRGVPPDVFGEKYSKYRQTRGTIVISDDEELEENMLTIDIPEHNGELQKEESNAGSKDLPQSTEGDVAQQHNRASQEDPTMTRYKPDVVDVSDGEEGVQARRNTTSNPETVSRPSPTSETDDMSQRQDGEGVSGAMPETAIPDDENRTWNRYEDLLLRETLYGSGASRKASPLKERPLSYRRNFRSDDHQRKPRLRLTLNVPLPTKSFLTEAFYRGEVVYTRKFGSRGIYAILVPGGEAGGKGFIQKQVKGKTVAGLFLTKTGLSQLYQNARMIKYSFEKLRKNEDFQPLDVTLERGKTALIRYPYTTFNIRDWGGKQFGKFAFREGEVEEFVDFLLNDLPKVFRSLRDVRVYRPPQ